MEGTSARGDSGPSGSPENVLRTTDKVQSSFLANLAKHGKYVVVGGTGCWWVGMQEAISDVWYGESGWIRNTMIAAITSHMFTIAIFLYLVVFLPYLRGYIPNYPKWQQSARLRIIVPVLTSSIFIGWTSYVVSLSQAGKRSPLSALGDAVKGVGEGDLGLISGREGLGLVKSIAGATALYVLTLGLLGLIQAPANTPVRKKKI